MGKQLRGIVYEPDSLQRSRNGPGAVWQTKSMTASRAFRYVSYVEDLSHLTNININLRRGDTCKFTEHILT